MKEKFQQFGKAMLVPVSLIALSGLFLGLGGALTTELTMTSLGVNWDWYSTSFLFDFFSVIKGLGNVIIGNLGPLYAVGCAFSLSRKEKGWAAFSALICYLAMLNTMQILLNLKGLNAANVSVDALVESGMTAIAASKIAGLYTTNLGFFCYNSGVFGGIIVGCVVAWITSKFYNTKLPAALSFFAGTRTVPIISLVTGGVLGILFYFIWPTIGGLFTNLAGFVSQSGLLGTFVYRLVDESLVPFGMHPILSTPMRWTELGGIATVDGVRVVGNSAIQLAQLASPEPGKLLVRAFMGGAGIINFALYPGEALAMYHCARKENKKKVAGLLIPTIVSTTCFGVTEPILFTFLFTAPWLYFCVHAPLAALGEAACEYFKVSIYQGNIKDWIPCFLRPEKINMIPYLWLMPIFFVAAYVLFRFLITKFDVPTPGREPNVDEDDIHLISKAEYNEKMAEKKNNSASINLDENADNGDSADIQLAKGIIQALGGKQNILDVDNCISRLRIVVQDGSLVAPDDVFKKQLKAMGVVHMGEKAIQIIYGPAVGGVAADVRDVLGI